MQTRSQTKNKDTVKDNNENSSSSKMSENNNSSSKKSENSSSKKGLITEREFRERMSDRTHSLVTNPECSNYLVHK